LEEEVGKPLLVLYFRRDVSNEKNDRYRMLEVVKRVEVIQYWVQDIKRNPFAKVLFSLGGSLQKRNAVMLKLYLTGSPKNWKPPSSKASPYVSRKHRASAESLFTILTSLSYQSGLKRLELKAYGKSFEECLKALCASLRHLDKIKILRIDNSELDHDCFKDFAEKTKLRSLSCC
jgi:hypothetical protein